MTEVLRLAKLVVFGCQMNERDSETIAGYLEGAGYGFTEDELKADLILYLTCCVRGNAEDRALGNLGQVKRLKKTRPGLKVGICGCMAQEGWVREALDERLSWLDLAFGTHNIHRLPELLARLDSGERVVEVWDSPQEVVEDLPVLRKDPLKAFVNITYGCDNFCTYCIVPYVRGRERSRAVFEITAECVKAAESGAKDITLLGQNVNAYGKGLGPVDGLARPDFPYLLAALDEALPDGSRLRFTTSHPRFVDDRMIEALSSLGKVCEQYHLPVQAGSDKVLRMMNRGYTAKEYLDMLDKVRKAVPGCAITSDVMVGFPGETEEDFQRTLDVVEEAGFDSAFTFVYSPRKGTAAESMPDQVLEEEKKDRIGRLIELQNKISLAANRKLLGSVEEVMAEGPSAKDPRMCSGRTRTNKMVHWPEADAKPGELVRVRIEKARTFVLHGTRADRT